MPEARTLIFGAGWIGRGFADRIKGSVLTQTDITNPDAVYAEIERVKPEIILNCAGKSGKPNVDACEKDPIGTFRVNVSGAINLATAAKENNAYFVHLSSGCFYDGDNGGEGFRESDPPNFLKNVYVRSKALAESALTEFDALQLRIRMPMAETPHPRNLLTKMISYSKVLRAANSITILEDFFPAALHLINGRKTGIFNMVNDGVEYHDQLLELYRQLINPEHRYQVIENQELNQHVLAPRSNCILSTEKLHRAGTSMRIVTQSLPELLKNYARHVAKGT